MVQRTHRPVAGQKFFHGSGTGLAPGTVQVPGDISIENVSPRRTPGACYYMLPVSYYNIYFALLIQLYLCILYGNYDLYFNVFIITLYRLIL